MAHDVIHISEKEAASDFASLLARVRGGAEVVIESESGKLPVADPSAGPDPAARSPSASRCYPRTRQLSWMQISPRMSKQLSRATTNRQPPPLLDDRRSEDRLTVSNSLLFRYRFHPHEFSFNFLHCRNTRHRAFPHPVRSHRISVES